MALIISIGYLMSAKRHDTSYVSIVMRKNTQKWRLQNFSLPIICYFVHSLIFIRSFPSFCVSFRQSVRRPLIRSSVLLCVRSFVRSVVRSFVSTFLLSFVSFLLLFVVGSFVLWFVLSLIWSTDRPLFGAVR